MAFLLVKVAIQKTNVIPVHDTVAMSRAFSALLLLRRAPRPSAWAEMKRAYGASEFAHPRRGYRQRNENRRANAVEAQGESREVLRFPSGEELHQR